MFSFDIDFSTDSTFVDHIVGSNCYGLQLEENFMNFGKFIICEVSFGLVI